MRRLTIQIHPLLAMIKKNRDMEDEITQSSLFMIVIDHQSQNLGGLRPQTPCGGCKNKIKVKTLGAIP